MNHLEALTRIEDYNNSDTSTMEKSAMKGLQNLKNYTCKFLKS